MTDKFNVIVIDYKTTSLTLKEIDTSPLSLNNITYLYKKCAFTSPNGFNVLHVWYVTNNNIEYCLELYGKFSGKIKNLYNFPTPIDHTIYGNCVILAKATHDDSYVNLSIDLWNKLSEIIKTQYEALQTTENNTNIDKNASAAKQKKKTTKQVVSKTSTNKLTSDDQTNQTNLLSNNLVTTTASVNESNDTNSTSDVLSEQDDDKIIVNELEREEYI